MKPIYRSGVAVFILFVSLAGGLIPVHAQPVSTGTVKPEARPYKVLTTGNQVTIRCTKDIKTIMAWTTTGSRILEKTVQAQLFSFRVPTQHKMVFLRIELADGKTYSEKIGVN
ncbi:MAG: hypothetical protein EOO09_17410 [Chitinophagaceae bacterium]|nr:MAG: hypothetical protein EOO09_17410 [Chitinophagaceae bacterium]